MKILVVCSNGRVGQEVVKESLDRGLDVTGLARSDNKSDVKKFIKKDLMDLTKEDIKDFDVLVDAFGVWDEKDQPLHISTLKHLSDLVSNTDKRLLIVGGAGSLYLDDTHTKQVQNLPDFPDAFKPLAYNMGLALDKLRKRDDVNWTYISPAVDFQADGDRTGSYILGGEEYFTNSNNESVISYSDYAIAMVDEIQNNKHNKERISVVRK